MRIDIDFQRCEGHGLCVGQAPRLFSFSDEGDLVDHLGGQDVPADLIGSARAAITSCPVAALREA